MNSQPLTKSTGYDDLEKELIKFIGKDYVLSSPIDLAVYECDGETLDIATPDLVVLPKSTEEVQKVVELANIYKVPVTPRGAGTGLSGGATAIMGGISLVLSRMTNIIKIDSESMVAHVETGVTNLAVSKAANQYGLYFAPDPSSGAASTIGGNIAENAGGPHTLKYGTTINHVLGAKVVLSNGTVAEFGGKVRDNLELDLLGAFIGSEGTLGVATEAYLHLSVKPKSVSTAIVYFTSLEKGGLAVADIIARGVVPAALEMIDKLTLKAVEDWLHLGLNTQAGALLIVELDGAQDEIEFEKQQVIECLQNHHPITVHWAASAAERDSIWKARKSAFGALGRIAPHGYVLDGVIPRSKLAQAISEIEAIAKESNVVIANVYHAGDGNMHPCLLFHRDNTDESKAVILAGQKILKLCTELGGTLSGEHGIGIEKVAEMPLMFSQSELKGMEWLRESFDPRSIFNPGKVLPTPKACGESGMRPLLRHQLSMSS